MSSKYIIFSVIMNERLRVRGFRPIIDNVSIQYSDDGTCCRADGKSYWRYEETEIFKHELNYIKENKIDKEEVDVILSKLKDKKDKTRYDINLIKLFKELQV